jgi:hypothetical protein
VTPEDIEEHQGDNDAGDYGDNEGIPLKYAEGGTGITGTDDAEDARPPERLADIKTFPYPPLGELVGNQRG